MNNYCDTNHLHQCMEYELEY